LVLDLLPERGLEAAGELLSGAYFHVRAVGLGLVHRLGKLQIAILFSKLKL
jgi:hypothetical protein